MRLELLLEQLDELRKKIERITDTLDQIAAGDQRAGLLMTIPGIGPLLPLRPSWPTWMIPIDSVPGPSGRTSGLVPREDSTGDHRRLGHITQEGPSTMRKLLTEAAWRGVSGSTKIQAVFDRRLQGDKHRRKLALVATAHWLCRVMLAMLKTGEAFRESDPMMQPRE